MEHQTDTVESIFENAGSFLETKISNLFIGLFTKVTSILGRKNSLSITEIVAKLLYFIYKLTPYKKILFPDQQNQEL